MNLRCDVARARCRQKRSPSFACHLAESYALFSAATAEPAMEFISCTLASFQAVRPTPSMVEELGRAAGLTRRLHQVVMAVPGQFSAGDQFQAWLTHTRQALDIKAAQVNYVCLKGQDSKRFNEIFEGLRC